MKLSLILLLLPLVVSAADQPTRWQAAKATNNQTAAANAASSAELRNAGDALDARVTELEARLAAVDEGAQATIDQLQAQVAALQAQLAQAIQERDAAVAAIEFAQPKIEELLVLLAAGKASPGG